jgi:hypothetical protein
VVPAPVPRLRTTEGLGHLHGRRWPGRRWWTAGCCVEPAATLS